MSYQGMERSAECLVSQDPNKQRTYMVGKIITQLPSTDKVVRVQGLTTFVT